MTQRHVLHLSPSQARLLVGALHAVAPTGGGSPQFHLANYLATSLQVDTTSAETDFWKLVGELQEVAAQEYNEAFPGRRELTERLRSSDTD